MNLSDEVFMRYSDFTGLVTTLLRVRHLVFDLQRTSTRFDHFLGEQVGGFVVTKTCIDVRNDWHNVGLETVDLCSDFSCFSRIACVVGFFQRTEQVVHFFGVSLTQEGIDFFDQGRYRGFFVHGLVWQWAKL